MSFEERLPYLQKYGMMGAFEVINWDIGPYCENNACVIPYGVTIGDGIPASVEVSLNNESHKVKSISVTFNSFYWEDFSKILMKKYGSSWSSEHSPLFIHEFHSKEKPLEVEQEILTHNTGGKNPKSKDTCELTATNYDIIYTHGDPLGAFHSIFQINLISDNL